MKQLAAFVLGLFLSSAIAQDRLPGNSIYNLQPQWKNQNGEALDWGALRGKPTVMALIYTRCQATCPFLIQDMKRIEESLPAGKKGSVQFALFSFDTSKDTAEILKEYQSKHSLDPARWSLYTGTPESVQKLAAVLGVKYRRDDKGEVVHSNVLTLLDRNGVVLFQQTGLRADPKKLIDQIP